ncbi:MAG: hypothetical protein ABFD52_04525 [Acidobacteriota bacterium]
MIERTRLISLFAAVLTLAALTGASGGAAAAGSGTASAGAPAGPAVATGLPKSLAGLAGPFDLAGPVAPEVRYYVQRTEFVHFGFDGRRTGIETYTVKMKVVPAALSGKGGDEYTVRQFIVRAGEGEPETIPSLAGWSYVFKSNASGRDEKGQVLGIPHDKFEALVTNTGRKIPGIGNYPIYNSFIDFHAFNDEFARPVEVGKGIQDLTAIGQTVRHASAFTEPPVNLGSAIREGSAFRNGDVRLTFKGIGLVDGAACAVVGYDSGESTLKMIMPQPDGRDMVTEGGSQYVGDIYIDLAGRWVRKVTMDEHVVTETRLAAAAGTAGQRFQGYTVRHLLTRQVGREEYER